MTRTDQFTNDYLTAHISKVSSSRPETGQYILRSIILTSANGEDDYTDDGEFIYPRSVTQESWIRYEGVVRLSCISIMIL